MSLLRVTRLPATDQTLHQLRSELTSTEDPLPLARFGDWLRDEERGRLRFWSVRKEVEGVDKGLMAVAVFTLSADSMSAAQDSFYVKGDYHNLREEFSGYFDAKLRAEGVLSVDGRSTEPRLGPNGLPIRPRGGASV